MIEQADELEQLRRQLSNIINIATVTNSSANTVDLQVGENPVKNIPFFVHCAGKVSHYRRPSVKEVCVLVNLGCGSSLSNAVALMGLPSTAFPSPTIDENQVLTDYGNGMTELYDLSSGSLTATYPGGFTLNANMNHNGDNTHVGDQEHTGSVNRTGDSIFTGNLTNTGMFNHMGGFSVGGGAGGGAASFVGGMEITNGDVVADSVSLKLHFHIDEEDRPVSKPK
nr:hypothetical protein BCU42_14335 [Vibrio splendidus]